MKPRKPKKQDGDFIRYDAQTYEKIGFLEVAGKVRQLAQSPRYWRVTVYPVTVDPETGIRQRHEFGFKTTERCMLSELSALVNDQIHSRDDYLPDCVSVMVKATVCR